MDQEYATEQQVSARFAIGIRHLRMMRARGTGPRFTKVSGRLGHSGGRIIYRVADVKEWLAGLPSGGAGPEPNAAAWPPSVEKRQKG
jgi:hypothetical protein